MRTAKSPTAAPTSPSSEQAAIAHRPRYGLATNSQLWSGRARRATDVQYQDVGTDIDTFHPRINDRELSLQVSAALSSVAKSAPSPVPNVPIMRQTKWESSVVVTLDKPTLIFTSDNTSDTGKTELELTATEIK